MPIGAQQRQITAAPPARRIRRSARGSRPGRIRRGPARRPIRGCCDSAARPAAPAHSSRSTSAATAKPWLACRRSARGALLLRASSPSSSEASDSSSGDSRAATRRSAQISFDASGVSVQRPRLLRSTCLTEERLGAPHQCPTHGGTTRRGPRRLASEPVSCTAPSSSSKAPLSSDSLTSRRRGRADLPLRADADAQHVVHSRGMPAGRLCTLSISAVANSLSRLRRMNTASISLQQLSRRICRPVANASVSSRKVGASTPTPVPK